MRVLPSASATGLASWMESLCSCRCRPSSAENALPELDWSFAELWAIAEALALLRSQTGNHARGQCKRGSERVAAGVNLGANQQTCEDPKGGVYQGPGEVWSAWPRAFVAAGTTLWGWGSWVQPVVGAWLVRDLIHSTVALYLRSSTERMAVSADRRPRWCCRPPGADGL